MSVENTPVNKILKDHYKIIDFYCKDGKSDNPDVISIIDLTSKIIVLNDMFKEINDYLISSEYESLIKSLKSGRDIA